MPVWIIIGVCAALVVMIAAVATATGFIRGGMAEPAGSQPLQVLPDPAAPGDIDGLRFSLAFRGYRMDEVDAVLDRLRDQVAEQGARISALEGAGTPDAATGGDAAPAPINAPFPDSAPDGDAGDGRPAGNHVG